MILEQVAVVVDGDSVHRSAECTWAGGAVTLETVAPLPVADRTPDPAAFVCGVLPMAMRLGEDLLVRAPVSAHLLGGLDEVQAAYDAWVVPMRRITIRAEPRPVVERPSPSAPSSRPRACFLSRGLDSLFTIAEARALGHPFDTLVFVDGLEPRHDPQVRAHEAERAAALADELGAPLVVARSNVRSVTDGFGFDWEDVLGAGLSSVAHALAGGLGSVTIPPTHSLRTFRACGSSPLLDPHYSTERLAIEHGSITSTRLGKIGWLAANEPALLGHLKVCYAQNRPDNCGECPKCVLTMLQLHVAGVLGAATQFPEAVDPAVVRAVHPRDSYHFRVEWSLTAERLAGTGHDGELRRAMVDVLRASTVAAGPRPADDRWLHHQTIGVADTDALLELFLEGRIPRAQPPSRPAEPTTVALVRRGEAGRFRCAVAAPGEAAGAAGRVLGALVLVPLPRSVPVWLADDGRLLTRGMPDPDGATLREPDGFLHLRGGDGRLPLHLATGDDGHDQLVTTDPAEAERLGYRDLRLLGHLEPVPADR